MPTKLTIQDAHDAAKSKGGLCLSKKYIGNKEPLRWQCKCGYKWSASLGNIRKGTWCPKCSTQRGADKIRKSIDDAKKLAKTFGGKCLSKTYVNNKTPLKWKCKKGHIWESKLNSVANGYWCLKCSGYAKKEIPELQEVAKQRYGKLLSKTYKNSKEKLKWECNEGHIFEANWQKVQTGSWCNYCKGGYGERLTRIIFEHIFKVKFPNTRPKWLRSPITNNVIELDGYNEKLKIAFEHQGMQHYKEIEFFNQNLGDRIIVDKHKKKECRKKGITLIDIPEIGSVIQPQDAFEYILNIVVKKKLPVKKKSPLTVKEYNKVYITGEKENFQKLKDFLKSHKCTVLNKIYPGIHGKLSLKCDVCGNKWKRIVNNTFEIQSFCQNCEEKSKLDECIDFAKNKGGKLISKKYKLALTKLDWECKQGHRWKMSPIVVLKGGQWCPKCGVRSRSQKAIENFLVNFTQLLKKRKWTFDSDKYVNASTRVPIVCEKGHEFNGLPTSIVKRGDGCPTCSRIANTERLRGSMEDVKQVSRKRGFKCLSNEYISARDKLNWQCKKGHKWKATLSSIKKGSECPKCSGREKLSIKVANQVAKLKGGKCLSKDYINNNSNLLWQCSKGHKWEASLKSIKNRGSWCLECSGNKKYTIDDCHKLAKSKKGKCLSKSYKSANTKMKWECDKGHVFEARFVSLKAMDGWCTICSRQRGAKARSLTIEQMHDIARERKGKCLSKKYEGNKIHLKWQCSEGHKWEATPANIKKGHWCPKCRKKN